MCGEKTPKVTRVRIEGAVIEACDRCAKLGTPVDPPKKAPVTYTFSKPAYSPPRPRATAPARPQRRRSTQAVRPDRMDLDHVEVTPDYAEIIKTAREKMSWSQDDLAAKLMEKKNVLSSIERGALRPDIKVARKLEKLLGIKLIETI
ncbi:MAG: multiprotein bridging factor aMBF1 [Candidatus Thermoplasmatota archaeon]|nr:multiprotein bridging factor aMBF1 [Candidatus Thermoplasmatota archaeon]